MARVKYYNTDTNRWEYADSAYSFDTNTGTGEDRKSVV